MSRLKVADNTGAKKLMCIKVLGGTRRRYARIGDIITVSVKQAQPYSMVKKGEVFRTAHEVVGKLVNYATKKGKSLTELNIKEYQKFSPLFGEDVYMITVDTSLAARDVSGGTSPKRVKQALARARRMMGRG